MSGEDYMAALRNKILAEVGTTKSESKGSDAGKEARQGSQVGGSSGAGSNSSNWGRGNSSNSNNSNSRFNDTRRRNYGGENRKQDSRRGPVPSGPSSGRQSRFQWNSGGGNNNSSSNNSNGNGNGNNGSRFQPNSSYRPDRRPEKKPVHSRNNNGGSQDGSSVPPWSRPSGDMHANGNGNVSSSNNNRSRFDRSRGRTFHRQSPSPDQAFADANRGRNANNRVTAVHSEESVFANVTDVRFNKMVIISPMTPGFSEHVVVVSTIKKFVESLDYDVGATENKVENVSVEKNRIIIEFNKVWLVPIVLACQKHLETILSSQFIWQRPSSYIVDTSNKDPILSENVHALMKLEPECEDESSTRQWLIDEKIEYTWIQFLKLKSGSNGDGNDAGNWVKALLYLPKSEDQVKLPMTIRPNHGTRRQDFKQITFENFATIAKSYEKKPSKVVCILNCVDPMDLKNENFVTEIKEAMMYGTPIQKCGEVESVQVPLPNPDFRNDIKHIHSSIGKVFIKFKDLVSAERAMILLPGTQFCQRTILCTYYSEVDYDMGIL